MKIVIDIDVELPHLNKCFFCLPLRAGLIAWGYVQLVLSLVYGIYICVEVAEPYHYHYKIVSRTFCFLFLLGWTILDCICCGFLIKGGHKNNGNFLEVAYNYLRVKVPAYAILLMVCLICKVSFYSRHWFDDLFWINFTLFDNPATGALLWLTQLYLLLLVNSMIVNLGHHMDFTTLYSRLRKNTDATPDQLTEIEDKEKKIDDVC